MTDAKPKRRCLQFSLGTFMLAITFFAAWLAFYYLSAKRAERAAKCCGANRGKRLLRLSACC